MTTFQLYILLILPEIKGMFFTMSLVGGIISLCTAVFSGISASDNKSDTEKYGRHMRRVNVALRCTMAAITVMMLTSFIPSTKIILALVAWELGSSIDGLANIPENLIEYLNLLIEAEIADLLPQENSE